MSTVPAENIPLPQSQQSPVPVDESLKVDQKNPGEGEKGDEGVNHESKAAKDVDSKADGETVNGADGQSSSTAIVEGQGEEDTKTKPLAKHNSDKQQTPPQQETNTEQPTQTQNQDAESEQGKSAGQSTSIPSLIRAPTPSSRTSTPPLASGSAPKKFASVNVNKKFLNKTITPVSGPASGSTKLGSLSSTSPVPSTSSTRLLSTKLTTVPTTKSSSSPNPSTSTGTPVPATSPWAKPAPLTVDDSAKPDSSGKLHQPAPSRARLLTTTPTVMGAGVGIGVNKQAWKAVNSDGKRAPLGLSRDFPTAREVAEGKREAQAVAQAKAAHNQAILQGLNAFTQLDPNAHRWEDEDDDDEVIDFGDGIVYPHHEHPREPVLDQPVAKNERFAEDFDRSWPRRAPAADEKQSIGEARRPDQNDRVLFNASSNRLEASTRQPPPQPTRLVSRDRPLPSHPVSDTADRAPLHQYNNAQTHGSSIQGRERLAPTSNPVVSTNRPAWTTPRINDSSASDRKLPSQQAAFGQSQSVAPPRPNASQPNPPAPVAPPQEAHVDPVSIIDSQAAEMHSAAEKARLRRLAEEQEREAAAERARQKAKELEERFGKKENKVADHPSPLQTLAPTPAAPVATQAAVPQPGFTLAQRPISTDATPRNTLPQRPTADPRTTEGSWRRGGPTGTEQVVREPTKGTSSDLPSARSQIPPSLPQDRDISLKAKILGQESQPAMEAEIANRSPETGGKRDQTFDNMLARIQAAMDEARANPVAAVVSSQQVEEPTEPLPPRPIAIEARPPVTEYFNITRTAIPKSPPPAWRTYTVKMPKVSAKRPPIPSHRMKSFASRVSAPAGWLLSFEPALKDLDPVTLSRGELLLPKPLYRRFGRQVEQGPIVSISPRKLQPFERKKKKVYETSRPAQAESIQTMESAAELLGEVSTTPAYIMGSTRPEDLIPTKAAAERWSKADGLVEVPPKVKSPVKSAAKAEKEGLFEGVGIGVPERARALSDAKPGVRFMVSSELEGDSLLEEVNKISLETVGEGFDEKTSPVEMRGRRNVSDTPPVMSTSSRVSTSPSNSTTPWTNAATQHDHIKSVWDQTPAQTSDTASRTEPPTLSLPGPAPFATSHGQSQTGQAAHTATSYVPSATTDAQTPMYPSLNAPSSADPPAPQPLNLNGQGIKMSYSHSHSSQPFSPGSQVFSTQSPGPYGYSQSDNHPQSHHSSNINLYRSGSGVNGYAQHQAVWSPTAFGTGYGYSKAPTQSQAIPSLDHKTGSSASFSATPGKELYGNNNDYRAFHAAHAQGQGQNQHGQTAPAHNFTAAAATAAAYNRNTVTSPVNSYGYYGAPGGSRGGRFGNAAAVSGQAGNGDYYGGLGGMEGGYYGGLSGGYAYGQSPNVGQGHGQQGHGAVGQQGHHQQGGRGMSMAAQRKMWGM